MRGIAKDESFGLRHMLSSGLVPEIQEEDLRAGGSPGTSDADDSGNMRGVRHRNIRNGDHGRTHPSAGFISTLAIDRGGREDYKEQQRTWYETSRWMCSSM